MDFFVLSTANDFIAFQRLQANLPNIAISFADRVQLAELKPLSELFFNGLDRAENTSEATTAVIKEPRSSMSDVLFFERLGEQMQQDFKNIAASSIPVKREPEDVMAVARMLSKSHSFG